MKIGREKEKEGERERERGGVGLEREREREKRGREGGRERVKRSVRISLGLRFTRGFKE